MGRQDDVADALLRARMEKLMREYEDRLFGTTASGPRPSFEERDFGRWRSKIDPRVHTRPWGESPLGQKRRTERSDEADAFAYAFGGSPSRSDTPSFKDANKERRSIFASRAYRAVSEEPPVAVAAMAYRVQLEADRRGKGRPGRLLQAETRLRKRIKRALLDTTPEQPFP